METKTLSEILSDLREFRKLQPKHDLSVLRHRYKPAKEEQEAENETEVKQPTKRSKRKVNDDE